jgi:hypothetical protein
MIDKIIKFIITLLPSITCLIFVEYFYDMGVIEPLPMIIMPVIFTLTLLLGIYTARKGQVGVLGHCLTMISFIVATIVIVNSYVPLASNEFVNINSKLEYRKDLKNSDLFFFKFSDEQIAKGIERYNTQVKKFSDAKDK